MTPLDSKVVLVTGATGGIGFATARRLAELGHRVRLVGRNAQRGDRAVDTIRASTGVDDVRFLAADLSSRASIRDLAARVLAQDDRLDVLLNNVGGLYADRWVTVDGDEATLAMNHHNPLLLTHLLLDRLRASAPSRVVFVTSGIAWHVSGSTTPRPSSSTGVSTPTARPSCAACWPRPSWRGGSGAPASPCTSPTPVGP